VLIASIFRYLFTCLYAFEYELTVAGIDNILPVCVVSGLQIIGPICVVYVLTWIICTTGLDDIRPVCIEY
jgi:hypothetical protein